MAAEGALARRHGARPGWWVWKGVGAPPVRSDFPRLPAAVPPGASGERLLDLLERGVFEHLGRAVEVGREVPDWRLGPRSAQRLWTVTLHYHAWAYALAEAAAGKAAPRSVRWRSSVTMSTTGSRAVARPSRARDLAWNAYAVATRIGWWVRALQAAGEPLLHGAPDFAQRLLSSLWQQASYLADHLEWDLRGNHLMRDLAGLAVAGRFFEGRGANAGRRAPKSSPGQCGEQLLPDGGHFERSPTTSWT